MTIKSINNVPLLGFAAYSGTGKTTLLEVLLPKLNRYRTKNWCVKACAS